MRLKATHKISPLEELVGGDLPPSSSQRLTGMKVIPIYLGPNNLDTCWCTACNCQIIFRCASILFILLLHSVAVIDTIPFLWQRRKTFLCFSQTFLHICHPSNKYLLSFTLIPCLLTLYHLNLMFSFFLLVDFFCSSWKKYMAFSVIPRRPTFWIQFQSNLRDDF